MGLTTDSYGKHITQHSFEDGLILRKHIVHPHEYHMDTRHVTNTSNESFLAVCVFYALCVYFGSLLIKYTFNSCKFLHD